MKELILNIKNTILKYILKLINLSVKTNMVPECWKIAKINMLLKDSSIKASPNNYRPISLISCLGKLVEKVIKGRLAYVLEKENYLVTQQSGFRAHRRTSDNLVFLTQKVQENFNRKKKICTLMFDILKAFD